MSTKAIFLGCITCLLAACQAQPTKYPPSAFVQAVPVSEPAPPAPALPAAPPVQPTPAPSTSETPKPPPSTASTPRTASRVARSAASPLQAVQGANKASVRAAESADYFNAIAQYAYEPGTLYQVYAAPLFITDIVLEPGEKLVTQPAAGDVVRWILAVGKSIQDGTEQTHVYIKPTRAGLRTNLAINTNRRSYLLELQSDETTYMAAVKWHYPQDELQRLQIQAAEADQQQRTSAPVVSLDALNFNYTIHVLNGTPAWKPTQVFDDGRRTFVRFPPAMRVREAPALFVLRDKETQLVNYRVKGEFYVIDRLFEEAELRLGQQNQEIVRIVRAGSKPPAPTAKGVRHVPRH